MAVFDGPQNTEKRKAIYSDYKIHRKKMPEDLYPQLQKCIDFCGIAGIPCLSIPGVEADDVMEASPTGREAREPMSIYAPATKTSANW